MSPARSPASSREFPERIVFFGTPHFAIPTLEALADAGAMPQWIVSQPARPVGRGRKLVQPPVGQWAEERGVRLDQPRKVRSKVFLDQLRAFEPDVAVVVAFGQIFPQILLDIPRLGCINLHGSLLPLYRGAAPVQAALLAGDRFTGVTTMLMEAGLDSGPMLLAEEVEIGHRQTAAELADVLATVGGDLVVRTLAGLQRGELEPRPQNHQAATHQGRIEKTDGRVDWKQSAREIFNRLRAFTPWPGMTARFMGAPLKILWAEPMEGPDPAAPDPDDLNPNDLNPSDLNLGPLSAPGTVLSVEDGLVVACGDASSLSIVRCQRPGRKPIAAADFVRGERVETGTRFD